MVRLPSGCTHVVATWTGGADLAEVAAAVWSVLSPDPARPPLEAVWRRDADGRFRAWSPLPGAPNDAGRVGEGETVTICVRAAAFLLRPVA